MAVMTWFGQTPRPEKGPSHVKGRGYQSLNSDIQLPATAGFFMSATSTG
jgi:hypothetical protein